MMTQTSTTSRIRTLVSVLVLVAFALAPGSVFGLRINGPGDVALAGALVQNFDSEAADTYFTNQTFSIGPDGFSIMPVGAELHIDDHFCASFGTSGNCLDTMNNGGQGNDDFSYVVNLVPEPNVAILLGLGLLTLAGTRIRDLQPSPPIRTGRE